MRGPASLCRRVDLFLSLRSPTRAYPRLRNRFLLLSVVACSPQQVTTSVTSNVISLGAGDRHGAGSLILPMECFQLYM